MKAIRLLPVLCLVVVPSLEAAVVYSNDFSGTGSNVKFDFETVPSGSASWAVGGGSYNYSPGTTINAGTAAEQITDATLENTGFTIQSQFTLAGLAADVSKFNNGSSTVGFGVFSNTTNFSPSAGGHYYLVDFSFVDSTVGNAEGLLRILKSNGSGGYTAVGTTGSADVNTASNVLAIDFNTIYLLQLTGSYNLSGHLTLTLSLLDANGAALAGTTSAVGTDTTPYTGDYFGYRNRIGLSGAGPVMQFDNYSITTVPEPSAALLVLGALGAGVLRRRGFLVS